MKQGNIIPLKITTEYSLLKSLIKIDDLISFLVCNNISACGICDDNLNGLMEFYLKCKKNNIKFSLEVFNGNRDCRLCHKKLL